MPYKGLGKNELPRGVGGDSTTGINNYDISKQGTAVVRAIDTPLLKSPLVDQTVDEGLEGYAGICIPSLMSTTGVVIRLNTSLCFF